MAKKGKKPLLKPSLRKQLTELVTRRWKMLTVVAAGIGTIFGAVAAVGKSWEYIGPRIPPTTQYMVEYVTDKVGSAKIEFQTAEQSNKQTLQSIQLDIANGKREAAERELSNMQIKQQEPLYKQNDSYRAMVDQSVHQIQGTIDKLKDQIRQLSR